MSPATLSARAALPRVPLLTCDGFSARLRQARESLHWSSRQLSERSGVAHATVLHIENGHVSTPRLDIFLSLAHALGVRAEWLALGLGARVRSWENRPVKVIHPCLGTDDTCTAHNTFTGCVTIARGQKP